MSRPQPVLVDGGNSDDHRFIVVVVVSLAFRLDVSTITLTLVLTCALLST
jgi:hypothetical protein